ncbi:hypothetical protein [Prauserella endophytica]|uniref:DNA primase/polymerase bifunctional N-terminal domain-containing protein n=1 Tax=Prauserella endophytica TaxID=1592324 RepID=A0ABY2RUC6_9PSEU|nr:hypothetical protein [Prauserella endophytica]TKG60919.1 hypothetical protein FCN18_34360 [Prauserella endophytica]
MLSTHPYPAGALTEMRCAATEYAAHGWPICRGVPAPPARTGTLEDQSVHAVTDLMCRGGPVSEDEAFEAWTHRPWPILLRPGAIGVIDLGPAGSGAEAALRSAGCLGPIVVGPGSRCYLIVDHATDVGVRAGDPPRSVREGCVLLPPSQVPRQISRWRITPEETGWSVPDYTSARAALNGQTRRD